MANETLWPTSAETIDVVGEVTVGSANTVNESGLLVAENPFESVTFTVTEEVAEVVRAAQTTEAVVTVGHPAGKPLQV